MTIRASYQNLAGSCGLGLVYSFIDVREGQYTHQMPVVQAGQYAGGTGFFNVAFVNTDTCRKAFDDLVKNYKVVFQSPTRRNNNSGRGFFFLVLDRSNRKRKDYEPIEARWPWKGAPRGAY